MTKKNINKLIKASYKDNYLIGEAVINIAGKLGMKDLKQFLKALKQEEKKRTVYVESAVRLNNVSIWKNVFKGKKIKNIINPDLMGGVKIINGDDITDLSICKRLDDMNRFINSPQN